MWAAHPRPETARSRTQNLSFSKMRGCERVRDFFCFFFFERGFFAVAVGFSRSGDRATLCHGNGDRRRLPVARRPTRASRRRLRNRRRYRAGREMLDSERGARRRRGLFALCSRPLGTHTPTPTHRETCGAQKSRRSGLSLHPRPSPIDNCLDTAPGISTRIRRFPSVTNGVTGSCERSTYGRLCSANFPLFHSRRFCELNERWGRSATGEVCTGIGNVSVSKSL
jgi:hypothetical protein